MSRIGLLVWLLTTLSAPLVWADVYVHTDQSDFAAGTHDSTFASAAGAVELDSRGLVVSTRSGSPTPYAREWDGSSYGPEHQALDVGSSSIFRLEAASSPRRREAVLTTLASNGQTTAQIWDGQGFSDRVVLGSGWNIPNHPQVVVAYESLSGDAMVVYEKGPGTPYYRVWDGTAWSAEAPVGLSNTERPTELFLTADPGSDTLIVMTVDGEWLATGNVHAAVWNGSAWVDAIELQTDGSARDESPCAQFMRDSGRALVLWADGLTLTPRYRLYDGGWGPELTAPVTGSRPPEQIRLEAEPTSDRLVMTVVGLGDGSGNNWREVWVNIWDGSGWGSPNLFTDSSQGVLRDRAHAAFESRTGRVIAVWQHQDENQPRYSIFDGTSWSAERLAPAVAGQPSTMALVSDSHSQEIRLAWTDEDRDEAGTYLWDGSSFVGPQVLESSVARPESQALVFLYDQHAPSFASPVIDSGLDGMDWGLVAWQTSGAADASVRLQVAASDADPPEDFVGPDGTPETYYRGASGSPLLLGTSGRYFRYRAQFASGLGGEAVLDEVSVSSGLPPTGPLFTPVPLSDPETPSRLAVGDLNDDGREDLVAIHPSGDTVSVLLSVGPVSFGRPTHYPVGCTPTDLRLADLDGDGVLDLVISGHGPPLSSPDDHGNVGLVGVLKGDGSGGLLEPSLFAAGSGPVALEVLDISGDSALDVALADPVMNGIVLLEGESRGRLTLSGFVSTGSGPTSLATGDLNGDGRSDLVASLPEAGGFVVLLGDLEVGLGAPDFFSTGSGPTQIALGDLNNDGPLDAVLSDEPTSNSVVLLGDGEGGFGESASFQTGSGPIGVVVAHLDGDCNLDVATANATSQDVSVLLGDGAGGLGVPSSFSVGGAPSSLALIDVEPDLDTDLAVSVPAADDIVILANDTSGLLAFSSSTIGTSCSGETFELIPSALNDVSRADHYVWDFGDGVVVEAESLEPLVHEYDKDGTYEVTLTAVAADGACLAGFGRVVTVHAAVEPRISGDSLECVEDVSGSVAVFVLDATGSRAWRPGSSLESWLWEDPEGFVVDPTAPVTRIEVPVDLAPLSVPVRLTVSDSERCSAALLSELTLHAVEPPAIEATLDSVCEGESTQLTATGAYPSYLWSSQQTTQAIVVAPTTDTTYSVTVSDGTPCRAEASVLVTVTPDTPVTLPVSGVRLTKGPAGAPVISYDPMGAEGYNLHRSDRPEDLPGAPPSRHVEGAAPFVDIPPSGTVYYSVRGASPCSGTSGP